MGRRLFLLSAAVLIASAGSARGQDAAAIEKGKQVYTAQKCMLCHSIEGKGNKKGALDDVATKLSADDIRHWIVNPKEMTAKAKATRQPPMKEYKLAAPDLDALVAYLSTLKAK
jgi:mono/diheme cytochrome c family protein